MGSLQCSVDCIHVYGPWYCAGYAWHHPHRPVVQDVAVQCDSRMKSSYSSSSRCVAVEVGSKEHVLGVG